VYSEYGEEQMTWTKDFQQALAHLDVNARLVAAGFSAEEMKQVDEMAYQMWTSDDPRTGAETLERLIEIAIFWVGNDHVPVVTPRRTFH
jgi:hypothetical protein